MSAPPDSPKGRRAVTATEDPTLGWRPSPGDLVPGRNTFQLERRLGEGGFGEVWLARHVGGRQPRVYKFCFQVDRLNGLKREVTIFRVLRDTLGDRDDIARVLDWRFDEAPFWIELEYTEGGDLPTWSEAQPGGLPAVPLDVRMELAAEVADALDAAHRVGVLHKDVKPNNVLVVAPTGGPAGRQPRARARLTDFGIGALTDLKLLELRQITSTRLTETLGNTPDSSRTGTRLYIAPELINDNAAASPKSDVYSLGVLIYQLAAGDFGRSLAHRWERDIDDPNLRDLIGRCVDRDPQIRPDAATVAAELRELPNRQARVTAEAERQKNVRRGAIIVAVAAAAIVGAFAMFRGGKDSTKPGDTKGSTTLAAETGPTPVPIKPTLTPTQPITSLSTSPYLNLSTPTPTPVPTLSTQPADVATRLLRPSPTSFFPLSTRPTGSYSNLSSGLSHSTVGSLSTPVTAAEILATSKTVSLFSVTPRPTSGLSRFLKDTPRPGMGYAESILASSTSSGSSTLRLAEPTPDWGLLGVPTTPTPSFYERTKLNTGASNIHRPANSFADDLSNFSSTPTLSTAFSERPSNVANPANTFDRPSNIANSARKPWEAPSTPPLSPTRAVRSAVADGSSTGTRDDASPATFRKLPSGELALVKGNSMVVLTEPGTAAETPSSPTVSNSAARSADPNTETAPDPDNPDGTLTTIATLSRGGETLTQDVRWDVYKTTASGKESGNPIKNSYDAEAHFQLPAGRYIIAAKTTNIERRAAVQVTSGTSGLRFKINLDAGILKPSATLTNDSEPLTADVTWTLTEIKTANTAIATEARSIRAYDANPSVLLPAARWRAAAKLGEAEATTEVTLAAGETATPTVNLDAGVVRAKALFSPAGESPESVVWTVNDVKPRLDGTRKTITTSYDNTPQIHLKAGKYYLQAKAGEAIQGQEVEIKAGQPTETEVILNAGLLAAKLGEGTPSDNIRWEVQAPKGNLAGDIKTITSSYDANPKLILPAGKYQLLLTRGGKQKAQKEIEITPGQRTEVEMAPGAAEKE